MSSMSNMGSLADLWTIGPTAAALALRTQGFTPQEATRLVELRRRYERGEFREIPIEQKRREFVRWLVEHGRLSEEMETVETEVDGSNGGDTGQADQTEERSAA